MTCTFEGWKECSKNEEITVTSTDWQYLESPGYPRQYKNRLDCGWNLKSKYPVGGVEVQVLAYDLEARYDHFDMDYDSHHLTVPGHMDTGFG